MFTYNIFPELLNKIAQEIMSDSDKLINLITHYQQALEHYAKKKNDAKMLHCIFKLSHMPITRKHLEETGVGRTVNSLRRLDEVGDAARTLVTKWKDMVSKQEEQEDGEEEEGEEEVQNIKSDTSKNAVRKSGQREKTDDNRSNSSHRNSDKNSDKGEKFSNHKREKHKEGSHSSRGSHVSTSQKDHKERQSKERRRSYEGHSDDDRERSQSDQKEHVSNTSDSEGSASSESTRDEMTSDSGNESDTNEYLKSINKKGNKVESKDTKRHSESHSKDKQVSSNNSSDRKSHKSSRSNRSVSKERTHSKSKEHTRDKSREKKKKEDDRHRDSKRDSIKRKRERSDSSDSEPVHKKHRSSERSKFERYNDSASDSSQEAFEKENSDDENRNSSQKRDASKKDSGRKEKERKESYRSSSHHNSSKSESKKYSEKSKDGNRKEKSSKENTKNDKKSDKKSESKSRSKPINKEIIKTENGICSSFGASFADALGMLEPTTSKGVAKKSKPHTVTSSPEKLKPEKSPEKKQSSKSEIPLPLLPSKLEPIDIDISSLLPTITPNYRPLGNLMENIQTSRNKILNDDEALCMVMSSKNQRTKVYSGNKIVWNTVPTLFELCTRILQDNIDALEYTGGVPYCILKPVLDKATPDQLFVMEHHNPYLMEDTDELWQLHCQREFRNKQREEMETWREMYMRCLDEREAKLKILKANIKQSQEKSTPVRKTQLAYVDSVVKPPRNVLKKQIKSGIEKRPAITPASRLTALAVAGAAGQVVVPNPGSRASSSGGSSSAHMKPKKAPLMQKTLQFLKGGRFRR